VTWLEARWIFIVADSTNRRICPMIVQGSQETNVERLGSNVMLRAAF
jgi:hypothetical protein